MKTGRLLYTLCSLAVASAFTACDSIDDDERYIKGEDIVAKRNVLIEDFTGQMCVNCPKAHKVIEDLKSAENGEAVVAVSIHAGASAIVAPAGLKTKEGDEYADTWGIASFPKGVINRTAPALDFGEWSAKVRTELEKETPLELNVSATLSLDGTSVNIDTDMKASEELQGKLQLWVTESNIVALQQLPTGGFDGYYVHDHVFRQSVNGTWGEDISLSLVDGVAHETRHHSLDISGTKWNAENLSVVAFVYNGNEGVLQVVEAPVKSLAKD